MGSLHIGMETINDMKRRSTVVVTECEFHYDLFVKLCISTDNYPYTKFSLCVSQRGNLSIESKYQNRWYHDYNLPGNFSFLFDFDCDRVSRFIKDNFIEMYLDNSESDICERMKKRFYA